MSEGRDPAALMEQGRQFQARHEMRDAVNAYLEAALIFLFDQADVGSARVALSAAYNVDPQNLEVIYNMGRADVLEGRVQEALAKFIDVLRKSNVQHMGALFEAGCVYESLNQPEQALLAFKRILEKNPMHVEATVHMGRLYEARGAKTEAVSHYLQAAEIAREYRQFATARRITQMVLALDSQNRKARYLVDEFDHGGHHEDEPLPKQTAAAPPAAQSRPHQEPEPHAPVAATAPAVPERPPQQSWAPQAQPTLRAPMAPVGDAETSTRHGALAAEVERLANEKSALETTLYQERALIEAALRRKSQLNTEIAKAQSALSRHEGDMATVEHQRRTELEAHLQQLTASLRELQSQTAAAKADLELARAERQALEQTLQKLRADIGAMAQSRADEEGASSSERDKARTELSAMQAQASEAKAQLEDARAQFENNVSVWEDRISRLRTEIEQLETQRAKLLKSSRA